ncbi:MAG: hypothetical protein AAF251_08240 [Pseudomonadota bacterium]
MSSKAEPDQSSLDQSNVYTTTIARLFLSSEKLADEWEAASLSVVLDGQDYDASGFKYRANGKAVPFAPRERELYLKLIEYRDYQAQQSGDPSWKACLLQVDRATNAFEITVEYDDATRWKITPANLKAMREALRP